MDKLRSAPQQDVSVILPTYNEAENILPLIDAVTEALGDRLLEIIVSDDDSPDGTWRLVEERARQSPDGRIRVLRRMRDRGLRASIQDGIHASRGSILAWMDCDLSMPASLLPRMVEQLDHDDVVVGSRFVAGGKDAREGAFIRRAASRVIVGLASRVLVPGFYDYTSNFIALKREVVDKIPLRGDYGEYFIHLVFRAYKAGFRIVELPYAFTPRLHGESKTEKGFVRRGVKYLWMIVQLRTEAMLED